MSDQRRPERPTWHVETAPRWHQERLPRPTALLPSSLKDVPDALWVLHCQVCEAAEDLDSEGLPVVLKVQG